MEKEKRLVDAEAIARKLKNAHCAECNVVRKVQCSACWVDDVLELLDGDTVDAVGVVHGRWIDRTKNIRGYYDYRYDCSVCEHIFWHGGIEVFNYCPNCGAKMDGDGNG